MQYPVVVGTWYDILHAMCAAAKKEKEMMVCNMPNNGVLTSEEMAAGIVVGLTLGECNASKIQSAHYSFLKIMAAASAELISL